MKMRKIRPREKKGVAIGWPNIPVGLGLMGFPGHRALNAKTRRVPGSQSLCYYTQSLAFQCRQKNMIESAEKLTLSAPWETHGGEGRAMCFLLPLMGWGRRTTFIHLLIHSLNEHSFLVPEEGSEWEDDVVPALKCGFCPHYLDRNEHIRILH